MPSINDLLTMQPKAVSSDKIKLTPSHIDNSTINTVVNPSAHTSTSSGSSGKINISNPDNHPLKTTLRVGLQQDNSQPSYNVFNGTMSTSQTGAGTVKSEAHFVDPVKYVATKADKMVGHYLGNTAEDIFKFVAPQDIVSLAILAIPMGRIGEMGVGLLEGMAKTALKFGAVGGVSQAIYNIKDKKPILQGVGESAGMGALMGAGGEPVARVLGDVRPIIQKVGAPIANYIGEHVANTVDNMLPEPIKKAAGITTQKISNVTQPVKNYVSGLFSIGGALGVKSINNIYTKLLNIKEVGSKVSYISTEILKNPEAAKDLLEFGKASAFYANDRIAKPNEVSGLASVFFHDKDEINNIMNTYLEAHPEINKDIANRLLNIRGELEENADWPEIEKWFNKVQDSLGKSKIRIKNLSLNQIKHYRGLPEDVGVKLNQLDQYIKDVRTNLIQTVTESKSEHANVLNGLKRDQETLIRQANNYIQLYKNTKQSLRSINSIFKYVNGVSAANNKLRTAWGTYDKIVNNFTEKISRSGKDASGLLEQYERAQKDAIDKLDKLNEAERILENTTKVFNKESLITNDDLKEYIVSRDAVDTARAQYQEAMGKVNQTTEDFEKLNISPKEYNRFDVAKKKVLRDVRDAQRKVRNAKEAEREYTQSKEASLKKMDEAKKKINEINGTQKELKQKLKDARQGLKEDPKLLRQRYMMLLKNAKGQLQHEIENARDIITQIENNKRISFHTWLPRSFNPQSSTKELKTTKIERALEIKTLDQLQQAIVNKYVFPAYHVTLSLIGHALAGEHLDALEISKQIANSPLFKDIDPELLKNFLSKVTIGTQDINKIYDAAFDLIKKDRGITDTELPQHAKRISKEAMQITRGLYAHVGSNELPNQATIDSIIDKIQKMHGSLKENPRFISALMHLSKEDAEELAARLDNIEDPSKVLEELELSNGGKDIIKNNWVLRKTYSRPNPFDTINSHFAQFRGAERYSDNKLENAAVGATMYLKRLALAISAPFHIKSLLFSNAYADNSVLKNLKNLFMGHDEFTKYLKDNLDVLKKIAIETNTGIKIAGTASTVVRGTFFNLASNDNFAGRLLNGVKKVGNFFDERLWNNTYTINKIESYKKAYDYLLKTGDRAGFEKLIDDVNTFFGGLPELMRMNPHVLNGIRLASFAPDWELSLIKQFGKAVTLDDYKSIKWYYNMLSYNIAFNGAVGAFWGNKPVTSDYKQFFSDVVHGRILSLFNNLVFTKTGPYDINTLGFEQEAMKLVAEPLLNYLDALTSGAPPIEAVKIFLNSGIKQILPKLSMPLQIALQGYNDYKSKSGYGDIIASFLPFILRSQPQKGETFTTSVSSSLTGIRFNKLTAPTLFGRLASSQEPSSNARQNLDQYWNNYAQQMQNVGYKGKLTDQAYASLLYQFNPYLVEVMSDYYAKGDDQGAMNYLNSQLTKFAPILKNSTLGRTLTRDKLTDIYYEVAKIAIREAKSKGHQTLHKNIAANTQLTE
jgi:hypothetical protein